MVVPTLRLRFFCLLIGCTLLAPVLEFVPMFGGGSCCLAADGKKDKEKEKPKDGDKKDKKDKKGKNDGDGSLRAFSPKTDITSPLYVVLEELIIPVIQYRDIKGFLAGTLVIDCKNDKVAKKIQTYLPIFRDRIFWDLYSLFAIIWSEDYEVDFKSLKQRIKKTVLSVWPEAEINDILIMDFHQISKDS